MEFLERNFVGGLWQVHPGDEMAAQDADLDLISVKICRRGLFQTLHTAANHAGRRRSTHWSMRACARSAAQMRVKYALLLVRRALLCAIRLTPTLHPE